MTQYFPYGVKLSKGQMEKLSRAYANQSEPITLRLGKSDLKGNHELMLTKTQIKKIQRAMEMNKGVDIKISKSQLSKVARHGGSLWSSLAGLSSKVLPMVVPLAKKAIAPLATGAMSGLASLGVNKLFGSGQTGGFLIPDSKVNRLIQYKDHLTAKQKRDILNALQTGSGVHIKPTQRQMGSGIGTILASIGIPMLLDAVMGKGLQIDSNRSRKSPPVKLPPKQGGLVLPVDYRSDPFIGTWEGPMVGLEIVGGSLPFPLVDFKKAWDVLSNPNLYKGPEVSGHNYTGPYNPLEQQLRYNPKTGEILEIYQQPTGKTDAIAMQHDVDYSVCKDDKKCKNKADRKMVQALDKVPYNERQWGHWLARNAINTKQKLGLGVSKNGKSRRVKKTGKKNWQMNYIHL